MAISLDCHLHAEGECPNAMMQVAPTGALYAQAMLIRETKRMHVIHTHARFGPQSTHETKTHACLVAPKQCTNDAHEAERPGTLPLRPTNGHMQPTRTNNTQHLLQAIQGPFLGEGAEELRQGDGVDGVGVHDAALQVTLSTGRQRLSSHQNIRLGFAADGEDARDALLQKKASE
eukprot:scaffold5550_cov22-Tisochrysis_lutea.AAC.1